MAPCQVDLRRAHRSAQVLALPKNLAAEMALQGRLKKGGIEGGKGGEASGESSGEVALADGILSAWQAEGVSQTDDEIDAIQREIDGIEDTL